MGEDSVRVRRLGLIGVGSWGRRYIDAIVARTDCRIVAFARGTNRTDTVVAGARQYDHWTDLVGLAVAGHLDGLIAAATPEAQAEIAAAAIDAAVPILVEKPIGLSAQAVSAVVSRFRQVPVRAPVVVDYIHLFAPAYRALRSRILSLPDGTAGVTGIDTEGFNDGPVRSWSSLFDYGPHDAAMCLDLLGVGANFRLLAARRLIPPDGPNRALFEVSCELGGVPVTMRVGNGADHKRRRFAARLSAGGPLVYDDMNPHPSKLTDGNLPIPVDRLSPLHAVLNHYLGLVDAWSIDRLSRPAADLDLSLAVARVLDAIGEATRP